MITRTANPDEAARLYIDTALPIAEQGPPTDQLSINQAQRNLLIEVSRELNSVVSSRHPSIQALQEQVYTLQVKMMAVVDYLYDEEE